MHLLTRHFARVVTVRVTDGKRTIQRVVKHMAGQLIGTFLAYLKDNVRMTFTKHAQNVAQMRRECVAIVPKPQSMSGFFGCDIRHRAGDFGKDLARSDKKTRSLFRQDETAAAGSLKQGTAKFLLHLSHLLPERRLGHMATLRGFRETQRLRSLFEIGKLTQFHGIPFRPNQLNLCKLLATPAQVNRHDPHRA